MDSKVFNCVRLVSCLHRLFLAIALQNTWCLADQIVHLERPSNPPNGELLSEPWFNPNNITVSVGEQIHFVARFASQRAYRPAGYTPFEWKFAESTYDAPCQYNGGIFSGYFLVDGTWNGSTFTLTVTDADPHFLYFSTYRQEANGQFCPGLGGWDSHFDLPVNQSVLFAINPNTTFSSAGYKENVLNATDVPISIASVDYSPHGGSLVVVSTDPYSTDNDTTVSCLGTNSTGNATQTPPLAAQGYSPSALAGGIVGAGIAGLVLGIVSTIVFMKFPRTANARTVAGGDGIARGNVDSQTEVDMLSSRLGGEEGTLSH